MTREQAVAAGWKTGKRRGDEVVEWWAIFSQRDKYGDRRIVEYRISGPEQLTLQAITSIERYPEAVKLLEECDTAMRAAHHVLTYSPKTDEDFAMNDAIEQCRDVIRLLNDVMLKLEARK